MQRNSSAWHLTFTLICHDIWHSTFDIWYSTSDIWHLTSDIWSDGTGTGTEGADSTCTDTYDIGTILSHFPWWILRLSAIQKNQWLTHSLHNIGSRDASASKKGCSTCAYRGWEICKACTKSVMAQNANFSIGWGSRVLNLRWSFWFTCFIAF